MGSFWWLKAAHWPWGYYTTHTHTHIPSSSSRVEIGLNSSLDYQTQISVTQHKNIPCMSCFCYSSLMSIKPGQYWGLKAARECAQKSTQDCCSPATKSIGQPAKCFTGLLLFHCLKLTTGLENNPGTRPRVCVRTIVVRRRCRDSTSETLRLSEEKYISVSSNMYHIYVCVYIVNIMCVKIILT